MTGRLFLIVGPSGAGKDTVIARLAAQAAPGDGVMIARRAITRPPHPGDAERHVPVTPDAFARLRAAGAFALDWESHGLRYGVGAEVRAWLAAGMTVVANGSRAALPQALAEVYSAAGAAGAAHAAWSMSKGPAGHAASHHLQGDVSAFTRDLIQVIVDMLLQGQAMDAASLWAGMSARFPDQMEPRPGGGDAPPAPTGTAQEPAGGRSGSERSVRPWRQCWLPSRAPCCCASMTWRPRRKHCRCGGPIGSNQR